MEAIGVLATTSFVQMGGPRLCVGCGEKRECEVGKVGIEMARRREESTINKGAPWRFVVREERRGIAVLGMRMLWLSE